MSLSELFAIYPALFPLLVTLVSLMVGSFLNVVIYRLPLMMERDWRQQCHEFLELQAPQDQQEQTVFNLAKPDSHCPHCKHAISALENIPVFSYLLQGGKCKHCKAPISLRYPLVETATALLSALIAVHFGFTWLTAFLLLFTWALVVLTLIDIDHQLLPDDITIPLLWLGLLVNSQGLLTDLYSAVIGAAAGYLLLWTVYWLFKLLTGKEGMGYGDFKLLGALGAWMGWQVLPSIILLSSVVGAVVGISLIVIKGQDKNVPIPFGPYLASAGFITLLWGDTLTNLFSLYFS
jgi:leader peptidase (prepilin peptidase)/N-methyltransferase